MAGGGVNCIGKLCRDCLRAWLDRPCPPRLEDTELWNRPPEEWCLCA